jgi:hypothetical protein
MRRRLCWGKVNQQPVLFAVGLLFLIGSIGGGQAATVTADDKFIDELIADLGFQPRALIDRVRSLANVPHEATTQRRLSYCVEAYAERIATDAKLREKVASEVDQKACARFQLCPREGLQRTDQSAMYTELLHVLASEMRGVKRAEASQVFKEHESFVEFGRRLARVRGVEEAFTQASSVNGEVSGPYILDSCPPAWNRWPILVSGLIAICVLAGVLAFVYKRKLKAAPT